MLTPMTKAIVVDAVALLAVAVSGLFCFVVLADIF
jgi:hypothetical protein